MYGVTRLTPWRAALPLRFVPRKDFAPRWPGAHAMAAVRPNNICIPTWFEKDQWRY